MSGLLAKLAFAVAVLAFVVTIAIAIARSDLAEERSGNQEPAGVQRIEQAGPSG